MPTEDTPCLHRGVGSSWLELKPGSASGFPGRSRLPSQRRPTLCPAWISPPVFSGTFPISCQLSSGFSAPVPLASTPAYTAAIFTLPSPHTALCPHHLSPPFTAKVLLCVCVFFMSLSVPEMSLTEVANNFPITKSKGHYFRPHLSAVFNK